jgi:hypothetical protein
MPVLDATFTPVSETAIAATALSAVFKAFNEGAAALLVSGRSLYDLTCHEGRLRTLVEVIRRNARQQGLHLVTYSLAAGLDYDAPRIETRAIVRRLSRRCARTSCLTSRATSTR